MVLVLKGEPAACDSSDQKSGSLDPRLPVDLVHGIWQEPGPGDSDWSASSFWAFGCEEHAWTRHVSHGFVAVLSKWHALLAAAFQQQGHQAWWRYIVSFSRLIFASNRIKRRCLGRLAAGSWPSCDLCGALPFFSVDLATTNAPGLQVCLQPSGTAWSSFWPEPKVCQRYPHQKHQETR